MAVPTSLFAESTSSGLPLAALNRILVTGEKVDVFNGMCGAESGQIPVAAAAPAMLFSEIEVQKRAHALNRPPILPNLRRCRAAGQEERERPGGKP